MCCSFESCSLLLRTHHYACHEEIASLCPAQLKQIFLSPYWCLPDNHFIWEWTWWFVIEGHRSQFQGTKSQWQVEQKHLCQLIQRAKMFQFLDLRWHSQNKVINSYSLKRTLKIKSKGSLAISSECTCRCQSLAWKISKPVVSSKFLLSTVIQQ